MYVSLYHATFDLDNYFFVRISVKIYFLGLRSVLYFSDRDEISPGDDSRQCPYYAQCQGQSDCSDLQAPSHLPTPNFCLLIRAFPKTRAIFTKNDENFGSEAEKQEN